MKSERRGNLIRRVCTTCEIASPPDFVGMVSK
jgi:hypothetical protein